MRSSFALAFACAASVSACSGKPAEVAAQRARPITVLRLARTTPPPSSLIPGIVTAHRETQIPFQVTGRVVRLITAGDDVEGEQLDQDGVVVQEGTILAELDPAPFERALSRAELRLEAARKELESQTVQLESVLPARLANARSVARAAQLNAELALDDVTASESAVSLAQTTLERNRELLPTGAVSDIAVRQSENGLQTQRARLAQARTTVTAREREYDAALASVSELEGTIDLQEASNAAQVASIDQLTEEVEDAREDLEDCILRAPFSGRVTAQHVGEGSFVQAGSPIVTLTMMNPIEAVVSVSANVESQLVAGTDAWIYPMDGNDVDRQQAVRATLYLKRGVADAGTRTFELGFIAANERKRPRDSAQGLPQVPYVTPVFDNPLAIPGGEGLYVLSDSVAEDDSGAWVMKVRGLSQGARTSETLEGTLYADRVSVRLGERKIQVASWALMRVADGSGLEPGDLLVPFPEPEFGDGFAMHDNRWLLRPGDLVQVAVDHGDAPSGFWVPVQAIRERNGTTRVFLVESGERVRAIDVHVRESSGELRRIEAPELGEGLELAHSGAHFLQDGDTVVRVGSPAPTER